MKPESFFFIIIFLVILYVPFVSSVTGKPVKPADNVIHIGTASGPKYNVTSIELEQATTYTIYFWNLRAEFHNLVIANSGRVVTVATASIQSDDILIGPDPSSIDSTDKGGSDRDPWIGELTTPSENKEITYFCSFSSHFVAGMKGSFRVGSTSSSSSSSSAQSISAPGFEIIFGFLIVTGFTVFKSRKR